MCCSLVLGYGVICVKKINKPIYDCFDTEYKDVFGAICQFQSCSFKLRFPDYMVVEQPTLVMFRPGFKERFIQFDFHDSEDGYAVYSCDFSPNNLGLHHYYFFFMQNNNRLYIKRKGASEGALDGNELFQLTVYEKGMTTPDWLKGGLIYQIFPDRFAHGGTLGDSDIVPSDRKLHTNWNECPDWRPDNMGKITNKDYFGGNLKGIQEKLPYLFSLGVSCIYLCPIFEAHENHRYNTASYEKIDPMLGNGVDFKELCRAAKEEFGIKIILDGVFSHTGADSVYFNKYGRYGEHSGAFRDPESPYRGWYSFSKYPEVYESWWGINTLPNVNENNPDYTKYICGEGGILQKWISLGAEGWRLDVADELPDEFIDNIRIAIKAMGEDKVLYGEVWEDASNKESYGVRRRYLTGNQLDSVMNYPFKELILNYVKYSDPVYFRDGVMTILEHYPKPSIDVLMNFISTHDTERALTRLGGEPVGGNGREWQSTKALSDAEYMYGIALIKCAMVFQFFLPGVPCVYYGDEAGVEGYKDPFNRRTYPWENEDTDLLAFVGELGEIRANCKCLAKGGFRFELVTNDTCIFTRYDRESKEGVVVYLNKSKRSQRFPLEFPPEKITGFKFMRRKNMARDKGVVQVPPYDYEIICYTLK